MLSRAKRVTTGNGVDKTGWKRSANHANPRAPAAITPYLGPQISIWLRKHAAAWVGGLPLTGVRDEIVALLDARGGVMSAVELAEAIVSTRDSPEPKRTAQAMGLIRAAVEAELTRGGDARVALYRFRGSDAVLVGREPDDPLR